MAVSMLRSQFKYRDVQIIFRAPRGCSLPVFHRLRKDSWGRNMSLVLAAVLTWSAGVLRVGNLAAAEAALLHAALATITADELRAHVSKLADDTFEGREAGSRGGHAAAVYLTRELAPLGLTPGGDRGGFFQAFGNGYRNVLGILEGSDPDLKQEYILVGAHYDHVGYGNAQNSFGPVGKIHNGADDNASGTAALLEIAEAFQLAGLRPKRSILFAFWDGEEKGLLGSRFWVENPTVPLERLVLAVNLDMIGRLRNGRLEVSGTRTALGLRRLVSMENRAPELVLDFRWTMEDNSDHHTFFSRGIPVLLLHTGLHENYHRPSDDAELVNIAGMHEVSRLLFRSVVSLTEMERPRFRTASRRESDEIRRRLERESPPPPSRLGVSWHSTSPDSGIVVTRVVRNSPAERAGLQPGDRIIAVGQMRITGAESFVSQVLASPATSSLEYVRSGREGSIHAPVQLQGMPIRVGVSWWEDDAEPGAVILSRVVPGSPADRAGLRQGDRIYRVDGQDFDDGAALAKILERVTGPFELLFERSGYVSSVTITPLSAAP